MIVFYYIAGFLVFAALLLGWFKSELPIFLCNKIFKKNFDTYWQVTDFIATKNEFFGAILNCSICFGFYLSIGIGSMIALVGGFGVLYSILAIGWLLPVVFFEKYIWKK